MRHDCDLGSRALDAGLESSGLNAGLGAAMLDVALGSSAAVAELGAALLDVVLGSSAALAAPPAVGCRLAVSPMTGRGSPALYVARK